MQTLYFDNDTSETYLIIYDISDNKRRYRVSRILNAFGTRVQRSAYECCLNDKQLEKLMNRLSKKSSEGDNIRIYRSKETKIVFECGEETIVTGGSVWII